MSARQQGGARQQGNRDGKIADRIPEHGSVAQRDPRRACRHRDAPHHQVKLCSECHALEQAVSVQGTEKDWRDVVDLMIERGANGSPEEFQTVIKYLSKHFGPKH